MKWAWLLLAGTLEAHVISMSSADFKVAGNRATYDLRMPLYEIQHVNTPEKSLFEQLDFKSGGVTGRVVERTCREDKEDNAYRCRAVFEWPAAVEQVDAYCGFHKVTVPNHVHLLHAYREDKSDQVVFDFSNTEQLIRFRPPTAFETWVKAMGSGFARVFSSAASVLFLACLAMAARGRRELAWMTVAFLAGEIAAALIVPLTEWNPAPRFVDAALALTVAYLAVEVLALPNAGQRWVVAAALGGFHGLAIAVYLTGTGYGAAPVLSGVALGDSILVGAAAFLLNRLGRLFTGLAVPAQRVSASLLMVFGLSWFFLALRG